MEKDTLIKVTNRDAGNVGYSIPELLVRRQFMSGETKEIPFNELESLAWQPGGKDLLKNYLIVHNEEVVSLLLSDVEPEYFYTEDQIKKIMTTGTLDEFLDCLDYAPVGVLEIIKNLAVSLPLNDVEKRDAILEKLNFNVTRAIEIRNSKYDGEEQKAEDKKKTSGRRASAESKSSRRASAPQYKVVNKE